MESILNIVKRPFFRRVAILVAMAGLLYLMKDLLTLFLLTFIFIYLINSAQNFIYNKLSPFIRIKRVFIVIFIYAAILTLLFLIIYIYAPKIITQTGALTSNIPKTVTNFFNGIHSTNPIVLTVKDYIQNMNFAHYLETGGTVLLNVVKGIGSISADVIFAIILSIFFMLEKKRIYAFLRRFKQSKIGFVYDEVKLFGKKFLNSFGKVIQTQITISFINSILSVIILSIIGFPNLIGLWIMVFLLGLVPVAGVFISLVPLSLIAYSIGGLRYIIYILILIAVLHAIESYILNPKLMSDKTKLPVFFTFLILIVSEHFLGIWGLIVGIPIVMFILDVLEVKQA